MGDYDRTPAALEAIGAQIVTRDVRLKPGGKCVYAFAPASDEGRGRLLCALSGNPASAMTNYYAVVLPALKKLAGRRDFLPVEIDVTLEKAFGKRSPQPRLLRGKLKFLNGRAVMEAASGQGNGVLSGMIGCNVMALVPAGSDALPAGTRLRAFLI